MQNMDIEIYYKIIDFTSKHGYRDFRKKLRCLQIPWKLKVNERDREVAKWNPPEISVFHSFEYYHNGVSELLLLSFHL
jgi:hypothetical protein